MVTYRPITRADKEIYCEMATAFYAGDAVLHPIPVAYIEATFEELMRSDLYTGAFVFETDGAVAGYALLAKTFSQEAGGLVWWVEELYVKEAYRSRKIGSGFLKQLLETLPTEVKRVRLEVERENQKAVNLYTSLGFSFLDYDQMYFGR